MITTIITTSHYCRQADKEQYRWRLISILSRRGYVRVQIICVWYVVVVTTVFAMLHLGLVQCLEEGNLLIFCRS